jgi:A/G-specific adenine glycosylase
MNNQSTIQKKLLAWYHAHKRDLPWRELDDPYKVWVSEVMLQQTRSETVISYYRRWLRTFPDLESLAAANEEQVLQIWEGLGYYQRALNLQKSARIIMNEYDAVLPDTASELKKLPGIGDYIAGAISSIVFGKREPALDGNGVRVLSRLTGFTEPVDTTNNKRHLRTILLNLLPGKNPGDFNQAIMDLGSGFCISKNPTCIKCPLKK